MAKLPPKPRNIVHDYFPVGTDGQSPMNALDGSAWEAMKFKQGELDEDGKPIRSAFPDIKGCPKGMERNAKGECVAIKKSPSWAKTVKDGKQYDTPTDKIETPVLSMQDGKSKKKGRTILGKNINDYKKRWAHRS